MTTNLGALAVLVLVLATAALAPAAAGCHAVEHAAAQDPQRCERDPKCSGKQDKSHDCITACVDDIACIDRCRQVTGQR